MEKKVVVFYHSGDLDGDASAAILYRHLKEQSVILIGVEYGASIDEIALTKDADIVYVVDFTFEPFDRMIELSKATNLIWIDHHKSSVEAVKRNENISFKGSLVENTKSAAYLSWEYFNPNLEVPYAIKQISLFDTWYHNNNEEILNFYDGLEATCKMNPLDDIWNRLFKNRDDRELENKIIDKGKIIRDYNILKHKEYASEHAFETEFEGYKAIVLNIGIPGSIKFNSVWDGSKYDIMIGFSRRKNHIWKISLYSDKKHIDCSAICKKYGGGGHKSAAGFETHEEIPFEI